MTRHERLVEHVQVDVKVEHLTAVGQILDGACERGARIPWRRRGDYDVGRPDESLLVRVEIPHVDHDDPIGRERRGDVRALTPLGVREAGADRHRHAAQGVRQARPRRVEVTVCVEPDQADARAGAVRVLQTPDDPRHVGAVAAHDEDGLPVAARRTVGSTTAYGTPAAS